MKELEVRVPVQEIGDHRKTSERALPNVGVVQQDNSAVR